jgi:16S rRNA (uracil1498-N3)-methyltransferase
LIETIIQKATELGAARIVPVITERVVPHLDREAVISKVERWKQTAVEAIKQCGTPWLPVVLAPLDFNSALAELSQQELVLVASLQTDHRHARDVVRDFFMQHGHQPSSICLWIGPEGDFSLEELAALRFAGAQAITLGQNVLRADTAAIAGLAIVMSALDALSSR